MRRPAGAGEEKRIDYAGILGLNARVPRELSQVPNGMWWGYGRGYRFSLPSSNDSFFQGLLPRNVLPMPAYAPDGDLTPRQAHQLARWILSLR